MKNLLLALPFLFLAFEASAGVKLTPEAADLKLRREMTGLGYAHKTTIISVLEYVRGKRGIQGPIVTSDDKPGQLAMTDAEGIRWTSETDGGVVEIQDERGRVPLVYETKTNWFKANETARMLLSLESLVAVGAVPDYRYGGGHIKIKLTPHFEEHPLQFASLINLFLKYEPILVHLMTHQRRVENAKPLMSVRMNAEQLRAAGLPWNTRMTLSQFLGHGLNEVLKGDKDCRLMNSAIKRRYTAEQKPQLSLKENCVLAWLAYFSSDVVGAREYGINLQSWRGAANLHRLKEALELRFFNAPKTAEEATLEEALVRAMADQAIRAGNTPILYEERMDGAYDLDSYFQSYFPDRRAGDFGELLRSSGFDGASVKVYFNEYLTDSKWAKRRSLN